MRSKKRPDKDFYTPLINETSMPYCGKMILDIFMVSPTSIIIANPFSKGPCWEKNIQQRLSNNAMAPSWEMVYPSPDKLNRETVKSIWQKEYSIFSPYNPLRIQLKWIRSR